MIKVQNMALPAQFGENELRAAASKKLRVPADRIEAIELSRLSIDARKKMKTREPSPIKLFENGREELNHRGSLVVDRWWHLTG